MLDCCPMSIFHYSIAFHCICGLWNFLSNWFDSHTHSLIPHAILSIVVDYEQINNSHVNLSINIWNASNPLSLRCIIIHRIHSTDVKFTVNMEHETWILCMIGNIGWNGLKWFNVISYFAIFTFEIIGVWLDFHLVVFISLHSTLFELFHR